MCSTSSIVFVGRASSPVTRITFWYLCFRILMQTEHVWMNGQETNYSQGTFLCPCWVFSWLLIRVKPDKNPWMPQSFDLRRSVDCTLCLGTKVCVLSNVKGGNSVSPDPTFRTTFLPQVKCRSQHWYERETPNPAKGTLSANANVSEQPSRY